MNRLIRRSTVATLALALLLTGCSSTEKDAATGHCGVDIKPGVPTYDVSATSRADVLGDTRIALVLIGDDCAQYARVTSVHGMTNVHFYRNRRHAIVVAGVLSAPSGSIHLVTPSRGKKRTIRLLASPTATPTPL